MATNRNDFFTNLNGSAVWDVGVPIQRGNPLPLDSRSVFKSLDDLNAYAAGVFSYPGHVVSVVTESEGTKVFVLDATCTPIEIGSGTGSSMLFLNSVDALTTFGEAPTGVADDLEVGQQAFVDGTVYYLTEIDDSKIDGTKYHWETQASDAPTWGSATNKVSFTEMAYAAYKALENKDNNTLYVITDKSMIFKGAVDVTSSVEVVESFDSLNAIEGKLYVHKTTFQARAYYGDSYVEFLPGILSDSAVWAEADGSKLATIALIKKGIAEAIATISTTVAFDKATGTVTVGGDSTAVLTDVAHAPTYDAASLTLTIPVYGGEDVVVNIPKDKFVTAGSYNAETGDIELTIDGQEEKVTFPATALVDVYVANNDGKNITVTVSDDNKISANLTLDPTAGNALVYTEQGFMVDISGKMDTYSAGNASELVLSDADGKTVARSGVSILSEGDLGNSATKVPVASVIASAIATAVNTATQTLTNLINGKMDKLAGSTADAGKIAVVDTNGTGVTIGTLKIDDLLTIASASTTYATKQSVEDLQTDLTTNYATKEEVNSLFTWTEL